MISDDYVLIKVFGAYALQGDFCDREASALSGSKMSPPMESQTLVLVLLVVATLAQADGGCSDEADDSAKTRWRWGGGGACIMAALRQRDRENRI